MDARAPGREAAAPQLAAPQLDDDLEVGAAPKISAHAYYVLGFLFVLSTFNFLDRQLLSILMEPIRAELGLSDTVLGLLSGFAFALFYATLGIPIARLADQYSRRNIIAIAAALWSVMTAISGFAQGLVSLLLPRIGVGVGQAGFSPAAYSLIADYFHPARRATALAIYAAGVSVGLLLGLAGGGWINHAFGWRMAFIVIGLPGVLLAFIFYLTAREPIRGLLDGKVAPAAATPVMVSLRHLWGLKTFRWLAIGSGVHAICIYGILQWTPSYLIRSFALDTREVGLWLGIIVGISGLAGTLIGGFTSDWLTRRDRRWYLLMPTFAIAVSIPFYLGSFLAVAPAMAFFLFFVPWFCGNLLSGPCLAVIQVLAPVHMRAMAGAFYLLVLNLVGLGAGPLVVGAASDLLHPFFGKDALRWALSGVTMLEFFVVYAFLRASRTVRDETPA
ncbi:MAG: MFS transporter [Alphaproteobacteria bacterium]|nr:MFS transporter [Alphaproteobacteria bacterium]